MEIIVKYRPGDKVKQRLTNLELLVIGYEYIEGQGVKYICVEPEKGDLVYLYDIMLEGTDEIVIGFKPEF